jgi:hypothetical protein
MNGREKSDSAEVAVKPANNRHAGGGAGGAKGRDRGECDPAKHVPDTGPDLGACAQEHPRLPPPR